MGLDWVLKTKVKDGHHADHARTRGRQKAARETIDAAWSTWLAGQKADGADVQYARFRAEHGDLFAPLVRLEDELDRHEVNPMAILEAPRVGIDPEATEYLREEHARYFCEGEQSWEDCLAENHGKYVPALAKKTAGLGAVTGIATSSTSFRGKVIGYAQEIIGVRLAEQAYTDMEPDAMLDYADELEDAVRGWAEEEGTQVQTWLALDNETLRKEPADVPHQVWDAWYVLRGAEWLRFWAEHDFSLRAWY